MSEQKSKDINIEEEIIITIKRGRMIKWSIGLILTFLSLISFISWIKPQIEEIAALPQIVKRQKQ